MAIVTLQGNDINLIGSLPEQGSSAPDFKLVAGDLSEKSLADFSSKKKILSIVPSLDTGVCAASTKIFNDKISQYDDAVVIIVSADLPFAMSRFCQAESASNVISLSMMRDKHFAKDYGVLMTDGSLAGLTARAIVLINEENKVAYTELVPEITQEPDYDAVLALL